MLFTNGIQNSPNYLANDSLNSRTDGTRVCVANHARMLPVRAWLQPCAHGCCAHARISCFHACFRACVATHARMHPCAHGCFAHARIYARMPPSLPCDIGGGRGGASLHARKRHMLCAKARGLTCVVEESKKPKSSKSPTTQ